jgi:hypothetical protein
MGEIAIALALNLAITISAVSRVDAHDLGRPI